MKKYILFLLSLLLAVPFSTSATTQSYSALWQDWVDQFYKSTYSQKNTPRKTYRIRTPNYQPYSSRKTSLKNTISTSRSRTSNSYFSRQRNSSQGRYLDYLWVNVNPLERSTDIQIVDETPIKLFEIGFSRPKQFDSLTFPSTYYVNKLSFDIIDNAGLVDDFSKFQLDINGESFNFETDGTITLSLKNARLTSGDDLSIDVAIKVEDANAIPHNPGYVRVRLKDVEAYDESNYQTVQTITKGDRISELIKWDPIPQVTETPVFGGQVRRIEGRTLQAGESEFVLSLNLEAHYDDMLIQNLTVRNITSGNALDSWSYRLRAYDMTNGEALGDSRFLSGKASFAFQANIKIGRNHQRKIGFRIYLNDKIRSSNENPEFQLDVYPSDVTVYGIGSGREVPTENMYFSSQSESFIVANSSIQVEESSSQPSYIFTNSSLETMYKFKIRNTGNKDISIARISANIWINGMSYPGGMSDDDFRLVLLKNNHSYDIDEFISTVKNSSKITFDTIDEITIPEGYEQEFGIQIALSEDDSSSNNTISINLLSDTTLSKDFLADLRSEDKNFIWSDHTAHPHSTDTNDFLSGYKVYGLPSNTYSLSN